MRGTTFRALLGLALVSSTTNPAYADGIFGPTAPKIPSTADVIKDAAAIDLAKETPSQYVYGGYTRIYKACGSYFDSLIAWQNKAGFTSDVATAGSNAASTIEAFAGVSTSTVGATVAGVGFLSNVLASFNNRALMTPYPTETKTLILSALDAYAGVNTPESTQSAGQAITRVQHYAEMCTYSGISGYAKQALSNATPKITPVVPSILTPNDLAYATRILNDLGVPDSAMTDDQWADLYYYFVSNPTAYSDSKIGPNVLKALPNAVSKVLGTGVNPTTQPKYADITSALGSIYSENTKFASLVASQAKAIASSGAPPVNAVSLESSYSAVRF